MTFYENTLITKQDLPKSELDKLKKNIMILLITTLEKLLKLKNGVLLNLAQKLENTIKVFIFIINLKEIKKL